MVHSEQAIDRDILVEQWPMNAIPGWRNLELSQLLITCSGQCRRNIRNRFADCLPINDQLQRAVLDSNVLNLVIKRHVHRLA